jgi:hypothetical protein
MSEEQLAEMIKAQRNENEKFRRSGNRFGLKQGEAHLKRLERMKRRQSHDAQ